MTLPVKNWKLELISWKLQCLNLANFVIGIGMFWIVICLLPKISYKDSGTARGSPRNGYAILMSSCSNEIAASLGKPDSWSCVSQVCYYATLMVFYVMLMLRYV